MDVLYTGGCVSLNETLDKQRSSGDFCDVKITLTPGDYIYAHKAILAECSPYFKQKFSENSTTTKMTEVFMAEVFHDLEMADRVIGALYKGKVDIRRETIHHMFRAYSCLLLDPMKRLCEWYMSQSISVDTCLDYWTVLSTSRNGDLPSDLSCKIQTECLDLLRHRIHDHVLHNETIFQLSCDQVLQLINKGVLELVNPELLSVTLLRFVLHKISSCAKDTLDVKNFVLAVGDMLMDNDRSLLCNVFKKPTSGVDMHSSCTDTTIIPHSELENTALEKYSKLIKEPVEVLELEKLVDAFILLSPSKMETNGKPQAMNIFVYLPKHRIWLYAGRTDIPTDDYGNTMKISECRFVANVGKCYLFTNDYPCFLVLTIASLVWKKVRIPLRDDQIVRKAFPVEIGGVLYVVVETETVDRGCSNKPLCSYLVIYRTTEQDEPIQIVRCPENTIDYKIGPLFVLEKTILVRIQNLYKTKSTRDGFVKFDLSKETASLVDKLDEPFFNHLDTNSLLVRCVDWLHVSNPSRWGSISIRVEIDKLIERNHSGYYADHQSTGNVQNSTPRDLDENSTMETKYETTPSKVKLADTDSHISLFSSGLTKADHHIVWRSSVWQLSGSKSTDANNRMFEFNLDNREDWGKEHPPPPSSVVLGVTSTTLESRNLKDYPLAKFTPTAMDNLEDEDGFVYSIH